MPGKKGNRPWVNLYCQAKRTRSTEKNKKTTTEKLELNKFCNVCRAQTPHKEGK